MPAPEHGADAAQTRIRELMDKSRYAEAAAEYQQGLFQRAVDLMEAQGVELPWDERSNEPSHVLFRLFASLENHLNDLGESAPPRLVVARFVLGALVEADAALNELDEVNDETIGRLLLAIADLGRADMAMCMIVSPTVAAAEAALAKHLNQSIGPAGRRPTWEIAALPEARLYCEQNGDKATLKGLAGHVQAWGETQVKAGKDHAFPREIESIAKGIRRMIRRGELPRLASQKEGTEGFRHSPAR
jgi:hypothetical protein